jgi:DNA-binding CsgD family transcriptional regulator
MSVTTHQIAHIRQLCSLGLPSEAIMPDLMKALGQVMDCHSGVFMWFDKSGNIKNIFVDIFLPEVVSLYIAEFDRLKLPYGPDLPSVAANGNIAGNYRVMPKGFYNSDMYNLICRPYDQHYMLDASIRHNGCALGALMLYRESGHSEFSAEEQAQLERLLPYITHALVNDVTRDNPLNEIATLLQGVILADLSGRISHIDPKAQQALFWVDDVNFASGNDIMARLDVTLNGIVSRLCRNIDQIRRLRDAPAPSVQLKHHCGQLHFGATLLQAYQPGIPDLVSISVTLQQYKPLAIMSRLERLAISPKQKELSLLVGLGYSAKEIAEKLGISQNTYKEYLQSIYHKLNINRKEDFYAMLNS